MLFAAAVSLARTGGSLAFAGGLLRASPGSFVLAGGLLSKTAREESFHVPERELPGVFFEEAGG